MKLTQILLATLTFFLFTSTYASPEDLLPALELLKSRDFELGGTYRLIDPETQISKDIVLKGYLGRGGSKLALETEDGLAIVIPNLSIDGIYAAAQWWEKNIDGEVDVANFLDDIGVPALNRKKAILVLSAEQNLKLPLFVSDSFNKYAENGWHIIDAKNARSSSWKESQTIFRNSSEAMKFQNWDAVIAPLFSDFYNLALNYFSVGLDSSNYALVKEENPYSPNQYKLRYFGYDFGGKYGHKTYFGFEHYSNDTGDYRYPWDVTLAKYWKADYQENFYKLAKSINHMAGHLVESELEKHGINLDSEKNQNFVWGVAKYQEQKFIELYSGDFEITPGFEKPKRSK